MFHIFSHHKSQAVHIACAQLTVLHLPVSVPHCSVHIAVCTPLLCSQCCLYCSFAFYGIFVSFFNRVSKISKSDYQLRHICPSFCLSPQNNWATTGRIFMTYLSTKFKFHWNLTTITIIKITTITIITTIIIIIITITTITGTSHEADRYMCISDHISLSSSYNEKCFRQKLYRKSKHTFCVQ